MAKTKIKGSKGDDVLVGTNRSDAIFGRSGNDVLLGRSGNDKLDGGKGNDKLLGGKGDDVLLGGSGNDELYGGKGSDKLLGGSGNDELYGGKGHDKLDGGKGDDLLAGGEGNDRLDGGKGDDVLVGGAGADRLTGGKGKDVFVFHATAASSDSSWAALDVITDFRRGEDKMDLTSLLGATELAWGGTAPTAYGAWHEVRGCETFVFADVDGDATTAELVVRLKGGHELDPTDFLGVLPGGNQPPVTSGEAVTTDEDTPFAGTVVDNTADPDNDPATLLYSLVGAVPAGLAFNADGSYLFDPRGLFDTLRAGESVQVAFAYRANDGTADSNVSTVTITVNGVNDAPVARGDIVLTNVPLGSPIVVPAFALLANDADVENDPLAIGSAGNPAEGDAVALAGGDVSYTDAAPAGGSFEYTASDGAAQSAPATVVVQTQAGNTVNGTDADEILIASSVVSSAPYVLNGGAGNDFLFGGGSASAHVLHGGPGNDYLRSGSPNDELYGEEGDDVLVGGDNTQFLFGGEGDDTLGGRGGEDVLVGGSGVDLLDFSEMTAGFAFALAEGGDGVATVNGTDFYFEMEGVIGGRGDDTLTGNSGDNLLQGGPGNDVLAGGAGADLFRFSFSAHPVVASGDGFDEIVDFAFGTDRLEFRGPGAGFTLEEFLAAFKLEEGDFEGDPGLDTRIALQDDSWAVTLLDVSGHSLEDFHATSVFS
jgi:VCBS repeat-containing protein